MDRRTFILGAGFSKAISSEMPLMNELSEKVIPDLGLPDTFAGFSSNIEHVLTFLSQDQPWLNPAHNLANRSKFFDAVAAIAGQISDGQRRAKLGGAPDVWLSDLIKYWHSEKSTVITLNYDTLVERATYFILGSDERFSSGHLYPKVLTRALTRGGGAFSLGDFPTFQLLKLHGSSNWYYSGFEDAVGETVYYVTANNWGFDDVREIEEEMLVRDKVPYIIPPTTDKGSVFRHETLRSVWRQAAQGINTAEEIFLIGYSLPQTDLGMLLFLKQNYRIGSQKPKVHVVDPNPATYDRIPEELGSVYAQGHHFSDVRDLVSYVK